MNFILFNFLCLLLAASRSLGQLLQCSTDDIACERCSSTCGSIDKSYLPDCCETFDACCDVYFNKCNQCTKFTNEDPYFAEYCCASFSSCCGHVDTISAIGAPRTNLRSSKRHPVNRALTRSQAAAKQNPEIETSPINDSAVQSVSSHRLESGPAVRRPTARRRKPIVQRRRPSRRREQLTGERQVPSTGRILAIRH